MSATPPSPPSSITEVRYSLPAMLAEIRAERASSGMAMDKLDQQEITKLFKARNVRRRANAKK